MRLWSLHPKYLDPQGLVALWRESLLAKAVLAGKTRGYRHHPQLARFQSQLLPQAAIDLYLLGVYNEASSRGYTFDAGKVSQTAEHFSIGVTAGQVQHEWHHLLQKLSVRSPALAEKWKSTAKPQCHPLFRVGPGLIEPWERVSPTSARN